MNVLKITTTPIRLSMTSQRARLDSEIPDPEIGIIQNPGRLNMKSENIKVNIDTSRSRDSMGFKTARGLMSDAAQAGLKAAADATAQYSRVGNQMMQIQDGGGYHEKSDARADECDDRNRIYPFRGSGYFLDSGGSGH